MNASSEAAEGVDVQEASPEFEAVFRAHYERIARVIARVLGDPARAEELASELFLKLWRDFPTHHQWCESWLYKSAVRRALDELRKKTRRARYENLVGFLHKQSYA